MLAVATSEVKVAQVVGRHLVHSLLGAEPHTAGEQDIPPAAGQRGVLPVRELVRGSAAAFLWVSDPLVGHV